MTMVCNSYPQRAACEIIGVGTEATRARCNLSAVVYHPYPQRTACEIIGAGTVAALRVRIIRTFSGEHRELRRLNARHLLFLETTLRKVSQRKEIVSAGSRRKMHATAIVPEHLIGLKVNLGLQSFELGLGEQ